MFANSGRAQLAYETTEVKSGIDVVLIHAGVNDRRSWRHVIERLSPRHRCVAFDTRGYGETTYEREDGWSPVIDVVAVLDAAGVTRPAAVVACSMGGQTAIDLALAHSIASPGWCSSARRSAAPPTPTSPKGRRPRSTPRSKRPTPPATSTRSPG
jgi:pimeloyl-ACP methyl ester carboxylesterase